MADVVIRSGQDAVTGDPYVEDIEGRLHFPGVGAGGTLGYTEFTTVLCGELQGSATALQMPDVDCSLVKFKARNDNAGNVYIGTSGVTKPDGTTDTTTGFELDAGEETGWLPASNLNIFYRICDNAGDDLTYIALV